MPRLPPELCKEILDHLRVDVPDDTATLRNCALSNRRFTDLAQKRLFSRVVVRGPVRPVLLKNIGGSAGSLEKILLTSPHLAAYIECLVIFDQPRFTHDESVIRLEIHHPDQCLDDWLSNDVYLRRIVPLIETSARSLKALIIQARPLLELTTLIAQTLINLMRLPTIEFLHISGSPAYLVQYGLGRSLKHVHLNYGLALPLVEPLRRQQLALQAPQSPIFLESLCIKCASEMEEAVQWLVNSHRNPFTANISKLKKLMVLPGHDEDHGPAWQLLQACANALEEFYFFPGLDMVWEHGEPRYPELIEEIDLGKLQKLRVLFVAFERIITSGGSDIDMFPWFLFFLRQRSRPNPCLEELTAQVYYRVDGILEPDIDNGILEPDINTWEQVSDILFNGPFPNLKKLRIYVDSFDKENAETIVEIMDKADFAQRLREKDGFELFLTSGKISSDSLFPFRPRSEWVGGERTHPSLD